MSLRYQNIHQKLIDQCVEQNGQAQYKIYELYYKAMYNTCLRIVNDTVEAEDILQESFLKAFQKIKTYKGEVSFGAWLKKIVVNHSLDFFKRKKLETEDIDAKAYKLPNQDNEDNFIMNEELLYKVKSTIPKLSDGYRTILSLYLLEGYDHGEISGIMNISEGTSRSQFSRAKKKLVELIHVS